MRRQHCRDVSRPRPIGHLGREQFTVARLTASEDGPLFDALEVAPIAPLNGHGVYESLEDIDDVPEEDRDRIMWTVFGHTPGEGVVAIGDFSSRDEALEVVRRLLGGLRPL